MWFFLNHFRRSAGVYPPIILESPNITSAVVGIQVAYTPGAVDNGSVTGYSWKVNLIEVATTQNYIPETLNSGKQITVTVFWTNAGGTVNSTSNTVIVQAGTTNYLVTGNGDILVTETSDFLNWS